MVDFLIFLTSKPNKDREVTVTPDFKVNRNTKDLLIKGGDFYAVFDERTALWSTKEQTVIDIVDAETLKKCEEYEASHPGITAVPMLMSRSRSGVIDQWHKFCKQQMRDNFVTLDEKVVFSNQETVREDYVSFKLDYPLLKGTYDAYTKLFNYDYGGLYLPEELTKLEWAAGSIIAGRSKDIQKFEVLYGDKGTGKGTWIKLLEKLFKGHIMYFNADELVSSSSPFGAESLKDNKLIAVQNDGNLSRIENNTALNSIVSHEYIAVNAKYERITKQRFNPFLFVGSNNPVKITDDKSGILRRLIDVSPSGRKLPYKEYHKLMKLLDFEKSAIAYHFLEVFEELGEDYYEGYTPITMLAATNDFFNFVEHNYDEYLTNDYVTLAEAWKQYDEYCSFANCRKMSYRPFRNELGNYFREFKERMRIDDKQVRSVYVGFLASKFENEDWRNGKGGDKNESEDGWLKLEEQDSLFDIVFANCPAQGCKADGSPKYKWENVKTCLRDINTSDLHWIRPGLKLICVDFDIKDENGEKSLKLNLEAANKWLPTYAEVSKSGKAIHLYYYYEGDVSELSSVYAPNIEIKVFTGNSSLRRIVSKCNDIPIATISSGLPLKKGDTHVIDKEIIKDEKHLRNIVVKALLKKTEHKDTTSNVHLIKKVLDDAYESGMKYDLSDMQDDVLKFAMKSSNQKDHCVNVVGEMHFKSDEDGGIVNDDTGHSRIKFTREAKDGKLVFFDIEIYRPDKKTDNPGLFLICWKYHGAASCQVLVNPKPHEVEELLDMLLVGFNCRAYDNPMMYAASMGWSNQQLYDLSQRIIVDGERPWNHAVNISYIDVFDMCTEKMSLKKWEYRLGITHKEMGIPWDEPAPLDRWNDIIAYCCNDVMATEAVFDANQGDYKARLFQVDLVKELHGETINVCPNDTTNTLSKRIIFGKETNPQSEFNYRDLSKPVGADQYDEYRKKFGDDYRFRVFDIHGCPIYRDFVPGEVLPEGWSILPFFPGYKCERDPKSGKLVSTYLGEKIGEGGRVYSSPGYYEWVWDGDIASQHPHSIIAEVLFGPKYTKIFKDIVDARLAAKHKDFASAEKLLNGALKKFLTEEDAPALAQALKIVINSIYGLTKAGFKNEFRDPRNFDNIVAKRGALFMTLLKHELEKRGAFVCHIKTDSIKIPRASQDVKDFVVKFGREFGYEFETEAVFTKFALFNDAAYLGYSTEGTWETKADQWKKSKQPFLYKTLFSHEAYELSDFCEVKSVTEGALYLDFNENLGETVDSEYEKQLKKLDRMYKKAEKKVIEENPGISDNWITRKVYDIYSDTCEFPELKEQNDLVEALQKEIPSHHDYTFVGRVGQFTPVKKGSGGGVLYVKRGDEFSAASGSKGYRWLESEDVKRSFGIDIVDMDFYRKKADDAKAVIDKTLKAAGIESGVDWFLSDAVPEEKYLENFDNTDLTFMNVPEGNFDEVPW